MRKLQEFYSEKYSIYFLLQPTVGKEPLRKWMPTTMEQVMAVEVVVEEEKADHAVVREKEKEAKAVAKVVVEAREAEEVELS